MFFGCHEINMDAKGRLAIPTKIRESLAQYSSERIVITAHTEERCLLVYPESRWLEILPKIENLSSFSKVARRTKRLLIGYATELEMDTNGRVLVPPTLREYAGLDKKLMLVGQGKNLELWSESGWTHCLDDSELTEDIPEEMKNLSL